MTGRPWMHAHPARNDRRRLVAESVLFILGLVAIVVAVSVTPA